MSKGKLFRKKFLTGLVTFAMILSMAGCGENGNGGETVESSVSQISEETQTTEASKTEESKTEESKTEESKTKESESQTESSQEIVQNPVVNEPLPIPETSVEMAKAMKLGWNLGNTLDATGSRGMKSETSWGQPSVTKELIEYVKASGFTTIRIPVSWNNHMSDGVIDSEWMDRVQEIVDWALDANLYVIINSHHDNDKYYPSDSKMEKSREYIRNIWTQISERFKDYDEHLIFESMNEPRLEGTSKEWWFAENDGDGLACIKNIVELNQIFVDTVRQSGGKNETRFLGVPSAMASSDNALNKAFSMPNDTIENHLLLSVHAYTPYDFTMNENGYDTWSSANNKEFDFMVNLKKQFINNGYGVYIGEFGATNKDNLSSRCSWADAYCSKAKVLGLSCILWDNGGTKKGNENFGMINRKKLEIYYPEILKKMVDAYN